MMDKPKFLPGKKANIVACDDLSGIVDMISWNGMQWTYTVIWWHEGDFKSGVFYERDLNK